MRKWLVTGAAGFLGSHVIEQLVKKGESVVALDNFSWGKREFLEPFKSKIVIEECDIRDITSIKRVLASHRPTHVVHLAALHFIPLAIKDPSFAIDINVRGTQVLLQAQRETETNPEAFWFASTGDVYAPSLGALHEKNSTIAPFNIYGLSKLMCEQIIQLELSQQAKTKFIIGRLFNLYGTRETNPHIIPEIVEQLKKQDAKKNKKATLSLGNTWPKRDMVPVSDAAYSVIESCLKVTSPLTIANFATGVAWSMDDLIHAMGEICGIKIEVIKDPAKIRSVEREHLQADVNKLSELIGKACGSDLKQGLKDLMIFEKLL